MINVIQGFDVGSPLPVDGRVLLSKAEMLGINDNIMPDKYFAICKEDGHLYLYNKLSTANSETGKFEKAIPEKVSELVNDAGYDVKSEAITRETSLKTDLEARLVSHQQLQTALLPYSFINETGNKLKLNYDSTAYKFSIELLDKNNNNLSTTQEVDLPIESVVVDARYDAANKKIILILKNGNTIEVPVGDLVSGLVTETVFNEHKNNTTIHINASERSSWNSKYNKPVDGIPSSDLSNGVNSSLQKADTSVQPAAIGDMATKTWTNEQGFLKQVDISGKADKTYVDTELAKKQDIISAGNGISINDNTIKVKAADRSISVGEFGVHVPVITTSLEVTDNGVAVKLADDSIVAYNSGTGTKGIKVNKDVIQPKLTAGANITIENNVISATDLTGVTRIKMNGEEKSPSSEGVVDLGAVVTAHQSLADYRKSDAQDIIDSGKQDKLTAGTGISIIKDSEGNNVISSTSSSTTWENIQGDDPLVNAPLANEFNKKANLTTLSAHIEDGDIHVTSADKVNWNNKYTKPLNGIPNTDLSSGVQASLGLADSAIQEVDLTAGYYNKTATDNLLANKVDKVTGYSLSKNDFTDDLKTKLNGIADGAQVNVLEGVSVDSTPLEISDKKVNIDLSGKANVSTVDGILEKIPTEATSSNQLADKDFVNSSIATQTATFRGTYNVITELGLTRAATQEEIAAALKLKIETVTNNDYAFVSFPNETVTTQFDKYERYKYSDNSESGEWVYEYELNHSSFTANQWAAINSGITSTLVGQISTNATNITTLDGKFMRYNDSAIYQNDVDITESVKDIINIHPEYTPHESGFYKITVDDMGHVSAVTPVAKSDITSLINYAAGSGLAATDAATERTLSVSYKKISLTNTGWSGSYPYTKTVDVQGVTANSTPVIDIIISSSATQAQVESLSDDWAKIFSVASGDNKLTFYATAALTNSSIDISVKGY